MSNRLTLYFAGFILAIVGFLMFDYTLRKDYISKKNQPRTVADATSEAAGPVVSDAAMRTRFLNRFKNFASHMGTFSDEPDASEEFLREFSKSIQPSDVVVLSEVLKDTSLPNAERTLALEIMSVNQDFNGHDLINSFVQNESFGASANSEFEIALRAQAIEGMTLFADKQLVRKNLENLQIRTQYAFLHDRAHRALEYLSQGLAPQTDSGDAKAEKR